MTERDPSINIPLPRELLTRLDAICRARLIGRRLVIQRAIEEIVARLEGQTEAP